MHNQHPTRCLSREDFAAPVGDRYFEDYVPGKSYEYGHVEVGADDIVAFARQYDPQAFHTDPQRAAEGPFGGLVASGWHTTTEMLNRDDDIVMSPKAMNFLRRRAAVD